MKISLDASSRWANISLPIIIVLFGWITSASADEKTEQLHAAAKSGDASLVEQLLAGGADVDAPSKYKATALSFAAQHGHLEVVKVLLDHDATIDVNDTFYNLTPLYWAAAKGHTSITEALIDAGAGDQVGALSIACKQGQVETAAAILAKTEFDKNILTDILIGNPNLKPDIADRLVVAGADPQRKPPTMLSETELEPFVGTYFSPDELLYQIKIRGPRLEMSRDGNLIHIIEPIDSSRFKPVGSEGTTITFDRSDDRATALEIQTASSTARYKRLESDDKDQKWIPRKDDPGAVVRSPKNWPSFRGPGASGIADGQYPPVNWNVQTGENIRWVAEIPGLGHSCPIVWGNDVFLTAAVSAAGDHSLRTGQYGDIDSVEDQSEHAWTLHCVDKQTGQIRWSREIHRGIPKVKRHLKSTHANPTPATDGRHVVVSLGSEGLFCFDFDGTLVWQRDLGKLASGWFYDDAFEWGFGSSPIIYQNLVIQQCDVGEDSFIAAYRIDSGEQVWWTPRAENPSWSSPTIFARPDGDELITAASNYVRGYDPLTGEERWRMARLSEVTIPTPVVADDLVYVTSGYREFKPIYAIRPGARGDITLADDETSSQFIAWKLDRGGPYMPTPIVYRGYLYVCPNNGLLSCYDAKTGERIYRERLKNSSGYTASPVAADGKLYFIGEVGDVSIVRAGPEFELLNRIEMGETCMATPAISDGMLFLRTQDHLYGIGATVPADATSSKK